MEKENNDNNNSWNIWAKHVLAEQERNSKDHSEIEKMIFDNQKELLNRIDLLKDSLIDKIGKQNTQIAVLKIKVGLIGLAAGIIGTGIIEAITRFIVK